MPAGSQTGELQSTGLGSGSSASLVQRPQPEPTARSWLDRPISNWWCALGWAVSSFLFVGIVQVLGGPAIGDSDESTTSTWSIAHGQFSCAFPKGRILAAPLYPLVSGAVSAAARLGSAVPFPGRHAFGPDCARSYEAVTTWSAAAHVTDETLLIGYVGWLALLVGAVCLLRATGRGRCWWEPVTVLLLACLPPVWMCLQNYFHPQDLVAMGLALAALACALRGSWVAAGALVTLAAFSQQFALLVAAPLFVVAPDRRRWAYTTAAVATAAVVLAWLLATSGSESTLGAALLGTGNQGEAGTVVSELHLHGDLLLFVSRFVPLELSVVLSWWVLQRLGRAAREPVPLLALVALSVSLRLVFERWIFGYYFMALAVLLLLLEVVGRRIRPAYAAWLAAVSVTYLVGPTTSHSVWSAAAWERDAHHLLAPAVMVLALGMAVRNVARGGPRRDRLVWFALGGAAALAWPSSDNPVSAHLSGAWWQAALVLLGISLAAGPIASRFQRETPSEGPEHAGSVPTAV